MLSSHTQGMVAESSVCTLLPLLTRLPPHQLHGCWADDEQRPVLGVAGSDTQRLQAGVHTSTAGKAHQGSSGMPTLHGHLPQGMAIYAAGVGSKSMQK